MLEAETGTKSMRFSTKVVEKSLNYEGVDINDVESFYDDFSY